jgi:hypothetical protein
VIEFLISWIWVIVRVWLFNCVDPTKGSLYLIRKCQSVWKFFIFCYLCRSSRYFFFVGNLSRYSLHSHGFSHKGKERDRLIKTTCLIAGLSAYRMDGQTWEYFRSSGTTERPNWR